MNKNISPLDTKTLTSNRRSLYLEEWMYCWTSEANKIALRSEHESKENKNQVH